MGNKKVIKERMAKLRRRLVKKQKKLLQIRIRIKKWRLRKQRVQKLRAKLKFSIDIKKKKELEVEEAQIDQDLAADLVEETTVAAEEIIVQTEVNTDEDTSLAELAAIEQEEKDDEIFEEVAQAEIDIVTEEEEAVAAEKEVEDVQKELDEEEEDTNMDDDIVDADETIKLAELVNVAYET
jgi:hypothetical protein